MISKPILLNTPTAFDGFAVGYDLLHAFNEEGSVRDALQRLKSEAHSSLRGLTELLPTQGDEVRKNAQSGLIASYPATAALLMDTHIPSDSTAALPPISAASLSPGFIEGLGLIFSEGETMVGSGSLVFLELQRQLELAIDERVRKDPVAIANIYFSARDGRCSRHSLCANIVTDKVLSLLHEGDIFKEWKTHPRRPLVVAYARQQLERTGMVAGGQKPQEMTDDEVMGVFIALSAGM